MSINSSRATEYRPYPTRKARRFASHPASPSGALLAAGAADPRLLSPVREWHQANFRELSTGKRHPLRVLVLMLAMDGFWLNEVLHTAAFGAELKESLMEELFSLADAAV